MRLYVLYVRMFDKLFNVFLNCVYIGDLVIEFNRFILREVF